MPEAGSRTEEREDYLSDIDRLRVRFALERGAPVQITVQLECEIGGRWVPVRRYDSAHGFFHVHPVPWDEARDRQVLVGVAGPKDALSLAINDLKANWERYRAACEADLGRTTREA